MTTGTESMAQQTTIKILAAGFMVCALALAAPSAQAACDQRSDSTLCGNLTTVFDKKVKEERDRVENVYKPPGSVKEYGTQDNRNKIFDMLKTSTVWNTPTSIFTTAQSLMNGLQSGISSMFGFGAGAAAGASGKININSGYVSGGPDREGKGTNQKDPTPPKCGDSSSDAIKNGC